MTLRIDGQYSARPASAVAMFAAFDTPATPSSPAAPQTPRPTTSSVQKKTTAAQAAQARADKAQRTLSNSPDRRNIEYLASARRDAAQAWSEVDREVKQLYASTSAPSPAPAVAVKPPYATPSGPGATTPPSTAAKNAFLDLLADLKRRALSGCKHFLVSHSTPSTA